MKLVIVESPTKSKTLQGFLGKDYNIQSSFGHVRDLPKSKLGIDVEKDFEPTYVIPTKSRKAVNVLKKAAKEATEVILATDEDREGEAIAFHLKEALELDNPKRIVFHEITKQAIKEALENPRSINMDLVDAQQARRILDRLVGYKLSPFLWKKVARGLSAGRVQSVAMRLISEREKEIAAFKPEEYWSIEADLEQTTTKKEFTAQLTKEDAKALSKMAITSEKDAKAILTNLKEAIYTVSNVETKEAKRNPLPPFTTSTLQQTAWQQFKYPARRTMQIAQRLYETGLITYHRTDSFNLSSLSLTVAEKVITKNYGKEYWAGPRRFKNRSKGAQEAHEAIRPSDPEKVPATIKLSPDQIKLYTLIWNRFTASQMKEAVFNATTIDIEAKSYTFRATGQVLLFDGFLKVYPMHFEQAELPEVKVEETLTLNKLNPLQHFTQPPPRYNEASLIKELESEGIGRPSTYASIISTIQDRNYVEKNDDKRFQPTEIGTTVNDLLVEHFPSIVDIKFTATMEDDLDKVAEGTTEWVPMIREFYDPFAKILEEKYEEVEKSDVSVQETDEKCPECGKPLLIRLGRFGKFYACSGFPECKYTAPLKENTLGIDCPKCKKGHLVAKRTKRRTTFYGCDKYPDCDFALWDKPTGEKCKECDSLLIEKKKKVQCSNSECTSHK